MKVNLEKLNLAMAKACMSTTELIQKTKINQGTLTRIKQGKKAYPSTIGKIARALGVTVEELINNSEE